MKSIVLYNSNNDDSEIREINLFGFYFQRIDNNAYDYNFKKPEQFTVKAHPALFEKEGDEQKNEALLSQSTVDIYFQNVHKTLFQSTIDIHIQNAHKTHNTAKARTLCVYIIHIVSEYQSF